MKGSSVLKKHLILYSILGISAVVSLLQADDLAEILSPEKRDIFNYKEKYNELQSDKLKKSWVNPIRLQYRKNYTTQFADQTIDTSNYSVLIDQPIFKSGGIFYSMKYSDALRGATAAEIALRKREMIGSAVRILFNFKKIRLEQEKLKLLVKNDEIDIKLKSDSFESGILDSSFLDQAIIKRNTDQTQLLALELELERLKNDFAFLSHKNPDRFKLPVLKLISEKNYKSEHLELRSDTLHAEEKQYLSKMTWSQYLPEVSMQGQYIKGDLNPLFGNPSLRDEYTNYSVTVSMPISINSLTDIEAGKVAYMEAATEVIDQKRRVDLEYQTILASLRIINKKIALDHKDEKLYQRLYTVTKNLEAAGEKTSYETAMMHNSLEIKKLDQRIHKIDKQLQLLSLYVKVNSVF
ncbi:MAG: TolC family protein [Campylobacterota bacterium]|nr:TolC family protein [Campylobacterota bacterium]